MQKYSSFRSYTTTASCRGALLCISGGALTDEMERELKRANKLRGTTTVEELNLPLEKKSQVGVPCIVSFSC